MIFLCFQSTVLTRNMTLRRNEKQLESQKMDLLQSKKAREDVLDEEVLLLGQVLVIENDWFV